jgi:hypothetical protein
VFHILCMLILAPLEIWYRRAESWGARTSPLILYTQIFTNIVPIILYTIHKYCANHSLQYSQILCQSFSTIFTNFVPIILYTIHKYCANHSLHYSQILCQSFSTLYTNIVPIILYNISKSRVMGSQNITTHSIYPNIHKYCANHSLQY